VRKRIRRRKRRCKKNESQEDLERGEERIRGGGGR
jgi:hypothetical protein